MAQPFLVKCILLCTPGMGVNLWGESPLYVNPVSKSLDLLAQVLAEGKGVAARRGLKEARVQVSEDSEAVSRRTETAYKAQSPGKLAPFDSAQGALSLPNGHNITKPRIQEIG